MTAEQGVAGVDASFWQEMLDEIDEDGDGQISYEEFRKHMMDLIASGKYELRNRELQTSKAPQKYQSDTPIPKYEPEVA